MCGLVGIIAGDHRTKPSLSLLERMADTLKHRGPDDSGIWLDPSGLVGIAHRRLSVIDLSKEGHQPMISANGRYVIAYNGEVYNFGELRNELERCGARFRGHSDTEVILAAISTWGLERALQTFVGMFALAVWDKENRILALGRDRMGEKPLYYGWQGKTFLFGSELNALRAFPDFQAEIDRDSLASFLRYSYIPAPKSIYRGIFKLLPGTILKIKAGDNAETKPVPYWSFLDVIQKGLEASFSGSDREAVEGLQSRLLKAITIQKVADVPLGAFLSGGIDSSTIVALMQTHSNRPVDTFTIGFNEKQYNEAAYAKAVAKHLGTTHTELYVTPEEARAVIPRLSMLYDEPFGDSSQIPTFLVCQLARRKITVCLSGDGGDELFGGYNRYRWISKLQKYPGPVRALMAKGLTAFRPETWNRICERAKHFFPDGLITSMPGDHAYKLASILTLESNFQMYQRLVSAWPDSNQVVFGGRDSFDLSAIWKKLADVRDPKNRMMVLDALTYLTDDILCKVDRAAMGVSLETRIPFLDHRVVEFAWSLPINMKIRNGKSKWILRQLLYSYVPRELVDRPKMGFDMPIDSWLRVSLRDWAEDLLSESRLRAQGYLDPKAIQEKWKQHLSGRRNWQNQLWNVLMFQSWLSARAH